MYIFSVHYNEFYKHLYPYNYHHNQDIEHIHHAQMFPVPHPGQSHSTLSCSNNLFAYCHYRLNLAFLAFPI